MPSCPVWASAAAGRSSSRPPPPTTRTLFPVDRRPRAGLLRAGTPPAPAFRPMMRESLLIANPGAAHGIGAELAWLEAQARRAIARGGSSLMSFRLYNRNERVSGETRDLLLTVDEWLNCEGRRAAAARRRCGNRDRPGRVRSHDGRGLYWPETGRLEAHGTFPSRCPRWLDRGLPMAWRPAMSRCRTGASCDPRRQDRPRRPVAVRGHEAGRGRQTSPWLRIATSRPNCPRR
jgi:hypothetical protein